MIQKEISFQNFIETLIQIQTHFEPDIHAHSAGTRDFALLIGNQIDLDQDELEVLSNASKIHDFGKVSISPALHNKPAQFTKAQYKDMQWHCQYGYDMLKPSGIDERILGVVLFHHERWNGSGYPTKIAGKQIPIFARIVAIADVYDALTNHRPYRPAFSSASAIKIMQTGNQFDPELLEIFTRIMKDKSHAAK